LIGDRVSNVDGSDVSAAFAVDGMDDEIAQATTA
jgi:hypothetical protein